MEFKIAFGNNGVVVDLVPTHRKEKRNYRTIDNSKVRNVRILTFNSTRSTQKMLQKKDLSIQLKNEDIEIDVELAGKIIQKARRIVVDENLVPVFDFKERDILEKPDGQVIKRDHKVSKKNINEIIPVIVSDQYFSPKSLLLKYIFRKSYFLFHKDDTSYGFLFELANFLADTNQFAKVVSFNQETKKPEPICLYQGGSLFSAAFLEGRVRNKEYCLILHLSDRELKLPPAQTR